MSEPDTQHIELLLSFMKCAAIGFEYGFIRVEDLLVDAEDR